MGKIDRRIQRTRRMLKEALLSLIDEKGYVKVTIRDLTERADIAYATFFRHYESKDDLLMTLLEKVLLDLEAQARDADGAYFIFEGRYLFEHIQEHARLYQNLLQHYEVVKRLKAMIITNIKSHAKQRYQHFPNPKIPLDLLLEHNVASLLNLIIWWLKNNQQASISEMAGYYERLVIQSGWWAVGDFNVNSVSDVD